MWRPYPVPYTLNTILFLWRLLMRAAVYKGNQRLSVEEIPTPSPGPGQVLVLGDLPVDMEEDLEQNDLVLCET